jgi:protein-tyrosine phosphatase
MKVLHLPTPDQQPPKLSDLAKGAKFIAEEIQEGGKVYVHCAHGEGRGPSMVIAYLISTGMTYEDGYEQVRKVRRFIRPTSTQIQQLKEFEKLYKMDVKLTS